MYIIREIFNFLLMTRQWTPPSGHCSQYMKIPPGYPGSSERHANFLNHCLETNDIITIPVIVPALLPNGNDTLGKPYSAKSAIVQYVPK